MGLALEAAGISKSYNGQSVLRDCSFRFVHGRTYALLGPNGVGKSTFFRIVALLEAPDAGEVRYSDNGVALPHDLRLRRRITLVLPQIGAFNTTVFNNVAYGLKVRGRRAPEVEDRVNGVLAVVGLTHKSRQNALDLSSGETKRLGLARALVIEPEVFLLDEPTANIDPKNTEIIEGIILKKKQEGQATILMITHDPAQAERLGDKLLFLREGRLAPA
jgi:tungstate transport system ATP-binding protein